MFSFNIIFFSSLYILLEKKSILKKLKDLNVDGVTSAEDGDTKYRPIYSSASIRVCDVKSYLTRRK
jgi:hypothetical protein